MCKNTQSEKGFTLIELMVAMALAGILMSAVLGVLSSSLMAWQINDRRSEAQQTARMAMDTMVRELRYAKSVKKIDNGIEFVAAEKVGTDKTIRYYVYSKKLRRENVTDGGGAQPVTGNNWNNANVGIGVEVDFEVVNSRTVTITITAADTFSDRYPRQTVTLTNTVVSYNVPKS